MAFLPDRDPCISTEIWKLTHVHRSLEVDIICHDGDEIEIYRMNVISNMKAVLSCIVAG